MTATFVHGIANCGGFIRTFLGRKGDPMIGCSK